MATFFLLISLIYSAIFYYLDSTIPGRSLLIESIIFGLFGFFMFFIFAKNSLKTSEENDKKVSYNLKLDTEKIKNIAYNFSYYIGFLLFYVSFYLIGSYFSINISYIILFMNVIIYLLFIGTERSNLGYDLFKVNANLFSIYYIFTYISNISGTTINTLPIIDIINTILIIFSFFVLIDHKNKSEEKDSVIIEYFFIYLFFFIFYYSFTLLFTNGIAYYLAGVAILYGIIVYEFVTKIDLFKPNIYELRLIGVIFSYVGILIGIVYSFFSFDLSLILIILMGLLFNYYVHHRLNNFLSLLFAVVGTNLLVINTITHYLKFGSIEYFALLFIFSIAAVGITFLAKFKHLIDYYTIHISSYFINIFSVIIFFVYNEFSLLNIGVILLLDSVYFLMSYFKLNQINS